ncbi:HAMP domain-containing histidine kinase [Bradyrhizobium diazoefficiens]|uniref:histidine kinase n=3 Tax=Bradyrhizobium diazoefficiens TaxID=1355477 RepID=A0A809ZEU3_9BRAD|nr:MULTISPECIES: HAMP domain-containing sensor histidine kinase [Bradyrhizobium]APO53100.1 ATPase [Bradyrhizobium diazoefficiens]KGJ70363.1 putative Sensor protein qseC [Bradyrhizobium diazoefficiens SEMIA 5080]KOY08974.1 ATPase [Bradyrhizobium diazoefficiens]MCD9293866.1 HAMP domain-containing histidine kinase [Bradyrhizobium diazoefficiens]MCD9813673.1 HAMP domain-containing histidine kinase [Bradyrhizobium diazoefficiens]
MSRHDDPYCLRSRLSWRLLSLQAALLLALVAVVVGALCASGLVLAERDEDRVIDVVQHALTRDAQGGLTVRPTPELKQLRSETPDLWFLVRDRQGHSLAEGAVPAEFAAIGGGLDQISQARLGWQLFEDDPRKPAARLKRVDTEAGNVQVITATQGRLTGAKALVMTSLAFLGIALPGLLLMGTATFIATPMIVRRAFRGLDTTADQARRIDIHQRGARLSVERIPLEVVPLVTAVNDALARLDQGYARHKRFVADAAHELRTPIAILNTRLESLAPGPDKTRLLEDAARLATLAEQLLDIQRLDRCGHPFARVDLVRVAQGAAADLAPLAIAGGYELALDAPTTPIETIGDAAALERALTNLVQNAIQHGPRRGTIGIRVSRPASIEVTDEGAGIPVGQREQIFEPFYRLTPLDRGAGLGLNMVREIVQLHGGHVSVTDGPDGGACFRITLRPIPQD